MVKKNSDIIDNVIVLRSANGKVGQKYYIQPSKNPQTGEYPEVIRYVDSNDNMIMSDADRNSGKIFIKESAIIVVEDGKVFDLKVPRQAAEWEAIKYCPLIAPDREAQDKNGNYLIDGTMDWNSKRPRYGVAELYVDRPGLVAQRRVNQKKKIVNACNFIYDDERGIEGRVLRAKLLGKKMDNMPDADVTDFLLQIAEKDPDKIINLYTGDDISLRILFIDAKDKNIIIYKNKVYSYGEDVVLGASDEAVISYLTDHKNRRVVDLIRKETYPEYEEQDNTSKGKK